MRSDEKGLKPDIDIRMKCWNLQSDEQLSKIKFSCKVAWTEVKANKDKLFFLRLSELVMGKMCPLGLPQQPSGVMEEDFSYVFANFEFTSDLFKSETPVANKTLIVEIFEQDKKKPEKHKLAGRTQFMMRDALKKA